MTHSLAAEGEWHGQARVNELVVAGDGESWQFSAGKKIVGGNALATQLAVTRSNPCWRIRDREDPLWRVLQAWRESATEQLTRRLETASTHPRESLCDVVTLRDRSA